MKNFLNTLLLICTMFSCTLGQNPASFALDAGPDQVISCNGNAVLTMSISNPCNDINGYSVISVPFNPPVAFDTGIPIQSNIDDRWSFVIHLPFQFCFYGNKYNDLIIGSNGVISFDIANAGGFCPWSFSASCPSTALIQNAIFGPYHDIDPGVSGTMYYDIFGTQPNRMFVVIFFDIPMFSGSCNTLLATHQIVLYETTNTIDVYIQNAPLCSTWNSGKKLLGIQNATGTIGISPPGRNTGSWSAQNEAWRFMPCVADTSISVAWYDGPTIISDSITITVSPITTTSYFAVCNYTNVCDSVVSIVDTVVVNPYENLFMSFDPPLPEICPGDSITITVHGGTQFLWMPGAYNDSAITVSPQITTTYSVFSSDNNNCSGISNITVNVHNIDKTISYISGVLFTNQSNALYQWVDCSQNYNLIPGANDQIYIPQENGEYAVIINYHGCIDTSDCFLVTNVGLTEMPRSTNSFIIFPNPGEKDFRVILPDSPKLKDSHMRIMNSLGQIVFEIYFTQKEENLKLDLPPGSYLALLKIHNETYIQKLIISTQIK